MSGEHHISDALVRAVSRMRVFYSDAWAHDPVLRFEDDAAFAASITRDDEMVLRVSMECLDGLERLRGG